MNKPKKILFNTVTIATPMGISASKREIDDIEAPVTSSKYGELLLDPSVKRKFDDLEALVRKNKQNDINYLCFAVKKVLKTTPEWMVQLSANYTQILADVATMDPELTTDSSRYLFLSNDTNLLRYFLFQLTGAAPSLEQVFTGTEGAETVSGLTEMMNGLREREARTRYYQFKYAQAMLFQVAYSQAVYEISTVFVDTTVAFHKTRERAFKSIYSQLIAIINSYVGKPQLAKEDLEAISKMKEKVDQTRQMMNVRKKMETSKTQNLTALLQVLITLDPDMGKDTPVPGKDLLHMTPTESACKAASPSLQSQIRANLPNPQSKKCKPRSRSCWNEVGKSFTHATQGHTSQ